MWTNDSQQILLEHFDVIYDSPSHIYHSALPLSPSSSWLHECYIAELTQEARVVGGLQVEWGMCSRTILLGSTPWTLSYWNNAVAVGSVHRDIFIFDAITGSQTAVLLGHIGGVQSLTFSSDGASLVSGSNGKSVKLWDMQTGGVVKTFSGHTGWVLSVSISADSTMIASGSYDKTIRLWNIQTGACHQIIEQEDKVNCVIFSPKCPQTLISASGRAVQQWGIDGHKVGSTYNGNQVVFSSDGIQLILCTEGTFTVLNISSGVVITKFQALDKNSGFCCSSPDGKLVAIVVCFTIRVWNITGSIPHLIETFVGHTNIITSLAFSSPSTLISASFDKSVKFWCIGTSSTNPATADQKSIPLTSAPMESIVLKTKHSPIIPSNLPDGSIKALGILPGTFRGSLPIPDENSNQNNIQPIESKLIFIWYAHKKVNVWDAEKGELLLTIDVYGGFVKNLGVSRDGSKVFQTDDNHIEAWDIRTGESMGNVRVRGYIGEVLASDDSKVWVETSGGGAGIQGWDFGIPGSSPVQLSNELPERFHINNTKLWETGMSRMKDTVTGKVVFQPSRRFGRTVHMQWNGQYLVVTFVLKKALILDFSHVSL